MLSRRNEWMYAIQREKELTKMPVTSRRTTLVNSARKKNAGRRKLSAKQIAAGFGGKRRQTAQKHHRPKHKAAKANKARSHHRPRSKPKTNMGKIVSYTLPGVDMATKKNKSHKRKASSHHRTTKKNTGHRRAHPLNPPSLHPAEISLLEC